MRILFLNPTGGIGGAETALLEVVAGLREQYPSWDIGVIAASDGPLIARARTLGADVRLVPFPPALARLGEWSWREHRLPHLRLALRAGRAAWPAWRYLARLRDSVRAFAPDIVHTNGLKMHLLGVAAKPQKTPLVWHLHDYIGRRPLSARLLKRYAHMCSELIAPSQSVADDVRRLGPSLPPIRTIWNAVDLERFSPEGDRLDLDEQSGLPPAGDGVVRVGLVATFARWKGHDLFLDAIARLPRSAHVRAYVIGGPVYEADESQLSLEELRKASDRLGLAGRVGFTGFLEDPAPAMRALDIVVHASTEPEPFGLTIAEGMACGRAVVVSLGGGAAELVAPGVDALTFAPGNRTGLTRSIEQLAVDSGLRQRLGRAARRTAERSFTRRRLVNDVVDVYERIGPSATLRVLHLHSGNLYGGVETVLTTLARDAATEPRMTSSFALCFEGRLSRELRAYGHHPRLLGAVRLSRPLTVRRARQSLAKLLAQQKADVVVCHQAWPYAIFGGTIQRAGLPLVLWLHTAGSGQHWLERWARRRNPDLAVSNSRFTARCLATWFPTARAETIYPAIRFGAGSTDGLLQREAIRQSLDTLRDDVVIVQVGRLESLKGNREALEAMATLRDMHGWKYWIVGGPQRASDERYLSELKKIASRRGISDRVRFLGERHDVPALLQAANIYCQPNVLPEAFGISLVEAQAAGLPIVTSALGGAQEIVDESCAMLLAPRDIQGLATALRRLISDASLRARLGGAARHRSSEFCNLTRQMQRTYEVLLTTAEKRPRPSFDATPSTLESSAKL